MARSPQSEDRHGGPPLADLAASDPLLAHASIMARPGGLEPPTRCLEGSRSVH